MFTGQLREKIEEEFELQMERLAYKKQEIYKSFSQCDEDTMQALKCLYASMPLSDGVDYPVSLFQEYAEHAGYLWRDGQFHGKIPEEIFAGYVLFHRVNNEELIRQRKYFYEKVKHLVEGKTMKEAVRAVNYWCASQVTYRSTDERTANPKSIFQAGYGRCGEESVFVVSVLRSVGIPARQVYVPWWSHCDDNHAWVEVWCDGEWQFLGACEPEEELNRGWFLRASKRAMLVHSNWMLPGKPQQEVAGKNGKAWMANQLSRYIKPVRLQIKVVDQEGNGVSGAIVQLQVLNYSSFRTIAWLRTNQQGYCEMETGKGSLFVTVSSLLGYGEGLVDTCRETRHLLEVKQGIEETKESWESFTFTAPADIPGRGCEITKEQLEKGQRKLELANQLREEKIKTIDYEKHIRCFLEDTKETGYPGEWKQWLVDGLSEKDRREISKELLEAYCEETFIGKKQWGEVEETLFREAILCPRVKNEKLHLFQREIRQWMTKEEQEEIHKHPEKVFAYVDNRVKELPECGYADLVTSAKGALESGYGSEETKKILEVQILRTLGIPARQNPIDESVEFWENGRFWNGKKEASGTIKITGNQDGWSLARKEAEGYQTLYVTGDEIKVIPGSYRILTVNRLPNGNSLCKKCDFTIKEREEKEISLEWMEAKSEELLTDYRLEDLTFHTLENTKKKMSECVEDGKKALFVWIDAGKEPTEHILNELYEKREAFCNLPVKCWFLIKNQEALQDHTLQRTLRGLKHTQILFADFGYELEQMARRIYQEPGRLPLILLVDENMRGLYGVAGYNVGTAEMIQKLLRVENPCECKKNRI